MSTDNRDPGRDAGASGTQAHSGGAASLALSGAGGVSDLTLSGSKRPHTATVVVVLVLAALALGALFMLGYMPLSHRERALAQEAEHIRTAPPQVAVVIAQPGAATRDLMLPGETIADQVSDLFARTNGYLKSWSVDIGDHVVAGQTLCLIETPEIDEELHQAEAALTQSKARVATAQANSKLTEITLKRYSELRDTKIISEQDYSERLAADEISHADLEAAKADVLVAEANQRRLKELRSFETVVAPFEGVISTRNTEVGSLVSSGSAPGAKPLFRINRIDVLRVFIDVPQTTAFDIKAGQTVHLIVREHPGQAFEGTVSRTAGVIDTTTRTLRVEVRVPNPKGLLLAGMYVQVTVSVADATPPLLVPGSTLIFNSDGNQLALVKDGHVHFQPVTVAGDSGKQIAISAGLLPTDQIIANPSAQLVEGENVEAMVVKPAGR
jgi:RND family efflux transporter MFP subunit